MLCLARALLGSSYKEGVLELNASDDRCPCTPFTASMVDCKLLLMLCLTDWNLLSGASMLLMLCHYRSGTCCLAQACLARWQTKAGQQLTCSASTGASRDISSRHCTGSRVLQQHGHALLVQADSELARP